MLRPGSGHFTLHFLEVSHFPMIALSGSADCFRVPCQNDAARDGSESRAGRWSFLSRRKSRRSLTLFPRIRGGHPDELVIQAAALTLPDGVPVFAVAACYCGFLSEGEEVLKPLRPFGSPVANLLGAMSYLQIQSLFDPFFPPGRHTYVKSNSIHALNDEVIAKSA